MDREDLKLEVQEVDKKLFYLSMVKHALIHDPSCLAEELHKQLLCNCDEGNIRINNPGTGPVNRVLSMQRIVCEDTEQDMLVVFINNPKYSNEFSLIEKFWFHASSYPDSPHNHLVLAGAICQAIVREQAQLMAEKDKLKALIDSAITPWEEDIVNQDKFISTPLLKFQYPSESEVNPVVSWREIVLHKQTGRVGEDWKRMLLCLEVHLKNTRDHVVAEIKRVEALLKEDLDE